MAVIFPDSPSPVVYRESGGRVIAPLYRMPHDVYEDRSRSALGQSSLWSPKPPRWSLHLTTLRLGSESEPTSPTTIFLG